MIKGVADSLLELYTCNDILDKEEENDIIENCIDDPEFIKNIPEEFQTKKILIAVCEGSKNYPGFDLNTLLEYVRDDLKVIIRDYPGHWSLGPNSTWYWCDS